jgi:hypothetical protein
MFWPFTKSLSPYVCIERILFLLKEKKTTSKEFTIKLNLNSDQTVTVTEEACQETKFYTKVKFCITRVHIKDRDNHFIKETKSKIPTMAIASDHKSLIDQDK